jgi:hypothetical protein
VRVLGDADEAPRQLAHPLAARREERRVRPAVAERHAEALRAADRDVGADLARRRQHRQRQQIGRHRDQRARVVRALAQIAPVRQGAVRRRVLHQHAEHALPWRKSNVAASPDAHLDAQRLRARAHDVDRLRMARVGHQERPAGASSFSSAGASACSMCIASAAAVPRPAATRSRSAGRSGRPPSSGS